MDAAQALIICRMVKAACPSQLIDEYTPSAWGALLDDIRFEDAQAAVIELCKLDLEPGQSRYIEPGHIRRRVKVIRSRRTDSFDMTQVSPPPGLTGEQYITWKRDVLERVGNGESAERINPPRLVRAALTDDERKALNLPARAA